MTYKSTKQPYCRVCGKAIKKATRKVYLELRPLSDGQRMLTGDFSRHVHTPEPIFDRTELVRHSNWQIVAVVYNKMDYCTVGLIDPKGRIASFSEWDGESYVDEFFCNGSHATTFAYIMACAYPTIVTKAANEAAKSRAEKETAQ